MRNYFLVLMILLSGCEQYPVKPKPVYGSNYIQPGGAKGSTATFTTTTPNTFTAGTTVVFTQEISCGAPPSFPIFHANTQYICVTSTGSKFTLDSNVIGVDGNLNVPTGTQVYDNSVTFQVKP